MFNSKRFLCFHWLNKDPESRKGHNSHLTTYMVSQVYDKTGQICFCLSVYFRKANLKPQPNGLYLEDTGELNWHSCSWEHTTCSQTRQQPKGRCISTSSKMTKLSINCKTRQWVSLHTTSTKINSLKTEWKVTGTDWENLMSPKWSACGSKRKNILAFLWQVYPVRPWGLASEPFALALKW